MPGGLHRTSHDGTIAFSVFFSPIRVVCQNTLSAALGLASARSRRQQGCRIRHTRIANALISRLPELIDMQRQQFTGGLAELRAMAVTLCTATQFRRYVETRFSDKLRVSINDRRGDATTNRPGGWLITLPGRAFCQVRRPGHRQRDPRGAGLDVGRLPGGDGASQP